MDAVLRWIEAHAGTAAWVQAFGSIAGLFAAIWIASSERRYRLRIEKSARKDFVDRAIEASQHSKKIIDNQIEFLTCDYIVRSELPRFIAVIENAASRIKELARNPIVDTSTFGNLSEVESALLDVHGLVVQCASSIDQNQDYRVELIRRSGHRVDNAIYSLQTSRKLR